MSVDVKYKTSATAIGGRDGRTPTEDGRIDLQLAVPKELGGSEAKVRTLSNSSQRASGVFHGRRQSCRSAVVVTNPIPPGRRTGFSTRFGDSLYGPS